ncbi:MAG: glycosyltransferase family 39 protein [Pseudomonadota bacterium]|nr:glycosyltransferase family 39 protein [Pseudomonadota bacterium]
MSRAGAFPIDTQRFTLFVIVAYALHLVARVLSPAALGRADAEQFVVAQSWAWGYGPQPPLVTWVYRALFLAFGENVFVVALFRNVCLAATVLTVAAIGRMCGGERIGILAGLGMFTIPQFAWESQHSHTHTLLVVVLAALAVLLILRIVERRRTIDYLLFGLALGLAFLAKFNGPVLPLCLVAVLCVDPRARRAVLDWRMLVALMLALAIVAPAVNWMLNHRDETLTRVWKFELDTVGPMLAGVKFIAAVVNFSLVTLAIWLAFLFATRKEPDSEPGGGSMPERRWLTIATLSALAIACVAAMVAGTGEVKERWLQPLLFVLPVLLGAWAVHRVGDRFLRGVAAVAAVVFVVTLIGVPVRDRFGAFRDAPLQSLDYRAMREAIAGIEPEIGTIFTDQHYLAGNLRRVSPEIAALVPEYPEAALELPRPWLALWKGRPGRPMRDSLVALIDAQGGRPTGDIRTVRQAHAWPFSGSYELNIQRVSPPGAAAREAGGSVAGN